MLSESSMAGRPTAGRMLEANKIPATAVAPRDALKHLNTIFMADALLNCIKESCEIK
jgi:hypothetical protein